MADGHLGKCKACTRKDTAERAERLSTNIDWIEKEAERCRIKSRRRRKPMSTEQQRLRNVKFRETQPIKYQAKIKTSNAIRDKKLTRMPCEVCGDTKVEAHHDDYSRPLDVRWLCKKHHMEHHVKLNSARRIARIRNKLNQSPF